MHNIVKQVVILCSLCICAKCALGAGADSAEFLQASCNISCNSSTTINVTTRTEMECTSQCIESRDIECRSITYDKNTGVCQLRDGQDGQFVMQLPPLTDPWSLYITSDNRTFRVIQQRLQGDINFTRNWIEYENGFGDSTDFWIGLKAIHNMTKTGRLLRVEATANTNQLYVAEYSGFTVADASDKYRMSFSSYNNVNMTEDSLISDRGMQFSTHDQDNDSHNSVHCASGTGGWWFSGCGLCNPNGFNGSYVNVPQRMFWSGAGTSYNPLLSIRLLLLV